MTSAVFRNAAITTSEVSGSHGPLQSCPIAKECSSESSQTDVIKNLNNLGVKADESCDLSKAESYFRRALEKVKKLIFLPEVTLPKDFRLLTSHSVGKRRDYDEGMDTSSNLIQIDTFPVSIHVVTAAILYNLGQIYINLNNDDDAQRYFSQSLQILRLSDDDCNGSKAVVNIITILQCIGKFQFQNSLYEEAIITYTKALRKARSSCNKNAQDMLNIASILNCLGVLHFHLPDCDPDNSLKFYRESLSIRCSVLGVENETTEIATTLNNIGRVHYMKDEFHEALEFYNLALRMRRNLLGRNHLDTAATSFNAAQTYQQNGDFDRAMELFQEFLAIAKVHLGAIHRDVAVALKCIAQIHHQKSNFGMSMQLYQEALSIGKSTFGVHHPEVANILNKIGNLHYDQGNFDVAVRVYREGLEIERSVFHEFHPNIVVTLTNLGQIYKLKKEYVEALQFHREALEIQRHSLGNPNPNVADTLCSIGTIYYQIHKYTLALGAYQEALQIRRDVYGDKHLGCAATLNSIGLVLFRMELHEYALQSFQKSLHIRRSLLGPDHHDVANVLYNIATVFLDNGDDDEAFTIYQETLRIERATLGKDHSEYVQSLLHIGLAHQKRGEFECALQYLHEALELQKTNIKDESNTTSIAETWNHIGNIYLQRGQGRQLVAAFSDALRYFRDVGKDESELVISGFNFYSIAKLHPECAPVA